jgi:hypothetical protein
MSGGANGKHEPVVGYLERVEIENSRSIASLRWEVTPAPGWNVILGDNGAGKSTVLRTVASFLLGDRDDTLMSDFAGWIRSGQFCQVTFRTAKIEVHDDELVDPPGRTEGFHRPFSAGFGPFRRFTGGDSDHEKRLAPFPRLARHMSLFSERVSLTEGLAWLKNLRFKELENDAASKALLGAIRTFVNQDGFLPNRAQLGPITSDDVIFEDGNGAKVPVDELSDGYRSILRILSKIKFHFLPLLGAIV